MITGAAAAGAATSVFTSSLSVASPPNKWVVNQTPPAVTIVVKVPKIVFFNPDNPTSFVSSDMIIF